MYFVSVDSNKAKADNDATLAKVTTSFFGRESINTAAKYNLLKSKNNVDQYFPAKKDHRMLDILGSDNKCYVRQKQER